MTQTKAEKAAYTHHYYEANANRLKAREEARRALKGDEIRATARAKREANLDAAKAKERRDYRSNRAAILERQRIRRAGWGQQAEVHRVSVAFLEGLWDQQDGTCAICRRALTRPIVDHDHTTGAVRGLLCFSCNVSIGHFKDNPAWMRAAAEYVERKPIGESVPRPEATVAA